MAAACGPRRRRRACSPAALRSGRARWPPSWWAMECPSSLAETGIQSFARDKPRPLFICPLCAGNAVTAVDGTSYWWSAKPGDVFGDSTSVILQILADGGSGFERPAAVTCDSIPVQMGSNEILAGQNLYLAGSTLTDAGALTALGVFDVSRARVRSSRWQYWRARRRGRSLMALGPDGGAILRGRLRHRADAGFFFEAGSSGFWSGVDPPGLPAVENQSPLAPVQPGPTARTARSRRRRGYAFYLTNSGMVAGPVLAISGADGGVLWSYQVGNIWRGHELLLAIGSDGTIYFMDTFGNLNALRQAKVKRLLRRRGAGLWPCCLQRSPGQYRGDRERWRKRLLLHPRAVRAAEPQPQDRMGAVPAASPGPAPRSLRLCSGQSAGAATRQRHAVDLRHRADRPRPAELGSHRRPDGSAEATVPHMAAGTTTLQQHCRCPYPQFCAPDPAFPRSSRDRCGRPVRSTSTNRPARDLRRRARRPSHLRDAASTVLENDAETGPAASRVLPEHRPTAHLPGRRLCGRPLPRRGAHPASGARSHRATDSLFSRRGLHRPRATPSEAAFGSAFTMAGTPAAQPRIAGTRTRMMTTQLGRLRFALGDAGCTVSGRRAESSHYFSCVTARRPLSGGLRRERLLRYPLTLVDEASGVVEMRRHGGRR